MPGSSHRLNKSEWNRWSENGKGLKLKSAIA